MKKIYPYLALAIIALLALIPPCQWFIENPPNDKWAWMVMIAGFLGVMTCFVKTNWYVRFIALGGFLNCFFSCIPYLSFTSYVLVVGCCWFYICCERVEDWTPIFKALQAVLILNTFLLVMEIFHKDPLLNFGVKGHIEQYGIMGHHMLMGSFSVVLSSLLISFSPINIIFPFVVGVVCTSTWSFLCAAIGLFMMIWPKARKYALIVFLSLTGVFFVWSHKEGKFIANLESGSGRGEVWEKSWNFSLKRPWMGWGLGSFKDVFPSLNVQPQKYIPYRNAHNFILQLLFEVGFPMTFGIVFCLGFFLWRLWSCKLYINAAGISMTLADGMIHFPDRVTQCVPILIALLAYSAFCLRRVE